MYFKISDKTIEIQKQPRVDLGISVQAGVQLVIQVAVIIVLLALPLGYFHVGYKRFAMAVALRGISYSDKNTAQAYLQNLTQQQISNHTNQEHFVEDFINWMHNNMKLQNRIVIHPNPVYLIEHGGICGQFATAATKILRANGYEARQVLLNWNGESTSHVIIEVKLDGRWTAFDPLGFGGGAYPQEAFISHIKDGQNKLNALDLYHRADLLPPNNTYNLNFFAQGKAIKIETAADYSEFSVEPDYLYGRDWPVVKTDEDQNSAWVYQEHSTNRLKDIEMWSVLPYFSRVTLWFGTKPIVLHFEYPILFLVLAAFLLIRFRKRLSRGWRIRGGIYLSLAFLLYTAGIIVVWINRYSL